MGKWQEVVNCSDSILSSSTEKPDYKSHAAAATIDVLGDIDEQLELATMQDEDEIKDDSPEKNFPSAPKKSGGRKAKNYQRSAKKKSISASKQKFLDEIERKKGKDMKSLVNESLVWMRDDVIECEACAKIISHVRSLHRHCELNKHKQNLVRWRELKNKQKRLLAQDVSPELPAIVVYAQTSV